MPVIHPHTPSWLEFSTDWLLASYTFIFLHFLFHSFYVSRATSHKQKPHPQCLPLQRHNTEWGGQWLGSSPEVTLYAEMTAVTSLGIAVTGVDISTSWGPPSPPCPGPRSQKPLAEPQGGWSGKKWFKCSLCAFPTLRKSSISCMPHWVWGAAQMPTKHSPPWKLASGGPEGWKLSFIPLGLGPWGSWELGTTPLSMSLNSSAGQVRRLRHPCRRDVQPRAKRKASKTKEVSPNCERKCIHTNTSINTCTWYRHTHSHA